MKKYFVIGNPIQHSLSPKLHNHWIKKNSLEAIYDKKKINEEDIGKIIEEIRDGKIEGINVTVPFKKLVIPYLDELSPLAAEANAVNTIYKEKNKIIGHNTDVGGCELGLRKIDFDLKNKIAFILGAGGVVPSIILSLKKLGISEIIISNRTKEKAENIKKNHPFVKVVNWGEIPNFDIIINATSLGLNHEDEIILDYNNLGLDKFFYDVIYNPVKTKFLLRAEQHGIKIENGMMMFIYQAHQAFAIWHKILPKIDEETINLLLP